MKNTLSFKIKLIREREGDLEEAVRGWSVGAGSGRRGVGCG